MRTPKPHRTDVLAEILRQAEHDALVTYLTEHNGNLSETATAVGITRRALDRKVDSHGLREMAGELRAKAGIRGPR